MPEIEQIVRRYLRVFVSENVAELAEIGVARMSRAPSGNPG
jgi:hypothetical protein